MSDYYTINIPEDIPPKAHWDGIGWQNKVTEYKGFKIGVLNNELPYLLAIETDIPELSGGFTKRREAQNAIDNYLERKVFNDGKHEDTGSHRTRD
jgi:hypothetical protein